MSWPTSSPRSTACATAAARSRRASTRPRTGRWAAACRPAWATSTRTPTAARSTWRWRPSRRPGPARRCCARSTRACATRPTTTTTSAPRRCCAAASGSPGYWSASTASCAPPTRRRASCLHVIPSRTATTSSGWCEAGWWTGAPCRPTKSCVERTQAALARPPGRAVVPGRRGRRDPHRGELGRRRRAARAAARPGAQCRRAARLRRGYGCAGACSAACLRFSSERSSHERM